MNLFFELLQLAIGRRDSLSHIPSSEEWNTLYALSRKQALGGVCFYGLQKLPKEMLPPRELFLMWLAMAESIKKRNLLLDVRAKKLTELFADGGFRSSVLKGQGVALLYDDASGNPANGTLGDYRQGGDIDIWVDADRDVVLDYVRSFGEVRSVDFKHSDFRFFDDVEVEIHSTPSWFYSPFKYNRFRLWLSAVTKNQFSVGAQGFASPTVEFNLVYALIHIYKHLFDEGVGLRQLMDYYFILMHSSEAERDTAYRTLCDFGMRHFAGATMFIMKVVFSMNDEHLLCAPSKGPGSRFLKIVMNGGNFGHYDKKNSHNNEENALQRGFRNLRHNMRIVLDYPSEVLWAPFWKVWHLIWRKLKGYC